jgi:hypothetical protein
MPACESTASPSSKTDFNYAIGMHRAHLDLRPKPDNQATSVPHGTDNEDIYHFSSGV